jgi:hypothetical protein
MEAKPANRDESFTKAEQGRRTLPLLDWLLPATWLLALTATIGYPYASSSSHLADDLTRFTVRLALVYYAAAATLMLLLGRDEWPASSGRGRAARWCWTLAWATYVVHLLMAFGPYHHWSHAAAVEHTQQVSGFGPGIWFSHCFTAIWSADVLFWWLRTERYAARPAWIDRLLHGFMAFIIFNATVVYEQGPIRWAGVILFTELAVVWLVRLGMRKVGYSVPG